MVGIHKCTYPSFVSREKSIFQNRITRDCCVCWGWKTLLPPILCCPCWLLNHTHAIWAKGYTHTEPRIANIEQYSVINIHLCFPLIARGVSICLTFSLFFFFLFILLPFCHSPINSEGLYQLGVQRCPPQSSIEGLEDTEVGSNSLPAYLPAAEDIGED